MVLWPERAGQGWSLKVFFIAKRIAGSLLIYCLAGPTYTMNIPRFPSIDDGRDSDAREMSSELRSPDISRASLSRPSSILGNRGMFIVYIGPARQYINNEPAVCFSGKERKDQPHSSSLWPDSHCLFPRSCSTSPPILYFSSPFLSTYSRNTPAYEK